MEEEGGVVEEKGRTSSQATRVDGGLGGVLGGRSRGRKKTGREVMRGGGSGLGGVAVGAARANRWNGDG